MLSGGSICVRTHCKNTPIQINRKFHIQKLKFSDKKNSNPDTFHISAQNIDCGYSLELEPLAEVVLTSTHNLCF